MTETASATAPPVLLRHLGRLLRPLIRLLIHNGITFPVLADLLRDLYVDVALRDVLTDEAARTDSRVSLLTGIHRKEIRRQRIAAAAAAPAPEAVTLSGQIVSRWLGQQPWVDAAGTPLPLPRAAPAGEPSFDALVAAVRPVTPIAEADAHGHLIGTPMAQPGVINYPKRALGLCGSMTKARFVTTTEVYPDSPSATPAECNAAQSVTVTAAIAYLLGSPA